MSTALTKFVVETLLPVLGAVMGALMPLVVLEIKKLIAAKTKNEQLRGVLDRVTDSAAEAVREISATVYQDVRQKAGDGKLDPLERQDLRRAALAKLKEIAARDIGDMVRLKGLSPREADSDLLAKLETAVDQMKLARVAAANAVPVAPVAGG